MTWFSYKEEINLTAGTRRGINLQTSCAPLSPSFSFYATGAKKKSVSDSVCISAQVTLLGRKRAGKWGVGVRLSRKKDFPFFRDGATDEKAESWSRAGPFHDLPRAAERQVARGLQQEECWGHLDVVSDHPGIVQWYFHDVCGVGTEWIIILLFSVRWLLAHTDPRWRQSPLCSWPKMGSDLSPLKPPWLLDIWPLQLGFFTFHMDGELLAHVPTLPLLNVKTHCKI